MTEERRNWLGYAITGKEFVAMEDLTRFGIDHWRGVRIEFERRGKQRTAEPHEYPALRNYIWIRPTLRQIRFLSDVRFLGRTFHMMPPATVDRFRVFCGEVEAREAEARKIIAAQEEAKRVAQERARSAESRQAALAAKKALIKASIAEYKAGDQIIIRDGVLAGELATFKRLVQGAHDLIPYIEAEIELMGRSTLLKVDPLAVRRAAGA